MCAHAVRVALKNITGVQSVDVSLSKGEAVATFAPGNSVRYEQLLRAIEKNGFVVKGATLVADGTITGKDGIYELQISGSNDRFRLEAATAASPAVARLAGKIAEITGSVPEVAKGKSSDAMKVESVAERQ